MKLTLALLSLLVGSSMTQFSIQGSPDLKTLRVAGVNPALSLAVQSALKNTYKPNPHPFMSSYVSVGSLVKY
jgi:hypothetical protein